MTDFKFDQNKYLRRINYTGETEPTFECLKELHHAQLYTIPFENLDICLNRTIHLDPENIFNKLVSNKRGGYCYELNGLFLMAIRSFGFDARALLGRVHITSIPTGRGHQISLITIQDRQWIADVGFGRGTPRAPIPFITNQPVTNDGQTVRLVESEQFGYMLQASNNDQWENIYSFDLEHVCEGDIKYANHYNSTHLDSLFVTSRVAARPIENGVVTLFNRTLKMNHGGKESETNLEENHSYIDALKVHFGIQLDASYEDLKPIIE